MNMNKAKYILIAVLLGGSAAAYAQTAGLPESALADTVSLGYQLSTSTLTGSYSIAGVNSAAIEKSPFIDVTKALYGKIAGLNVYQGTGASPVNVSTLSIHGRTPLVLIDGYPRDFEDITAGEIESVHILTDAAASALYGMRGANGVVLITTKRGKEGKLNVSVSYDMGVNTQFRSPEFADAYTYANAYNTALVSDGLAPRYNARELDAFRTGLYPYDFADVDWWKESVNKTGTTHNLKMSFNGGNDKFRYFTVIDYYHDRSMLKSNTVDDRFNSSPNDTRLSVRANLDVNITPTTVMKADIMGKLRETRSSLYERDASIFNVLYNTPSNAFPIRYENGIYGGSALWSNPVYLLTDNGDFRRIFSTMTADLSLRQDLGILVKGLGAELSVAFDNVGAMQESSTKTLSYMNSNASISDDGVLMTAPVVTGTDNPILAHGNGGNNTVVLRSDLQAKVDYSRSFGRHSVSAAVIYDMQALTRTTRNLSHKNQSVLATATYNYDERYTVTGVFNRSGSAYLPKGHRFANYPAVSAAWIISNESFMESVKNHVNLLKFRASYGLSGWDGNLTHELWRYVYGASGSYNFGANAGGLSGQGESTLPVENLLAERSEKASVGVELAAFGNRLRIDSEGFYEKRSDMLVPGANSVSGIIGVGVGKVCEGVQRFDGIDFSVSWQDKVGDFGYGLAFNGAYLTSEVIRDNQAYQEYDYLYTAGNRVGQCYGLEAIGFFASQQEINNSPVQTFSDVRPGDVKYKDQNGDNRIDEKDIVRMRGTTIPRFYYGFSMNLSYRRLELSADFQGVAGVTVNLLNSPLYKPLMNNGNISDTFLRNEVFWSPENKSVATMPRLTTLANENNYRNSSLWYRDGSFLKLRNLTVAYTFPKSVMRFADMKVFVTGTNLFSIDNIGFADPEQLAAAYPSVRSWWAGIKFNF